MRVIWELVFQNQGMPEIIIVYLAGGMGIHYYAPLADPYIPYRGEGALFEDMVPPASLAGACQMDG